MSEFNKNVFINCPFDDDFRQLLLCSIFTVKYLGYNPRVSIEKADSGDTRITKIINIIKESKFGIHDLSRIVSKSSNEHYRMNMPFELGIDYGYQKSGIEKWKTKKILVLEKERYRYQKALSDLSGSDIKAHNDEPIKIIKAIRDWFITEELKKGPSGNYIWNNYNEFQAYLYDELVEKDGHETVDEATIMEITNYMSNWLQRNT